jgi:hypothetical protein
MRCVLLAQSGHRFAFHRLCLRTESRFSGLAFLSRDFLALLSRF